MGRGLRHRPADAMPEMSQQEHSQGRGRQGLGRYQRPRQRTGIVPENRYMRICIPTRTKDGRKAAVYEHFGSAPCFTIYDVERDAIDIIDNFNQHHSHGLCQPTTALSGKNIEVVVCKGMGARAVQKLNEGGIRAYRAVAGTVEEIIREYEHGTLEEITAENACDQHSCQ